MTPGGAHVSLYVDAIHVGPREGCAICDGHGEAADREDLAAIAKIEAALLTDPLDGAPPVNVIPYASGEEANRWDRERAGR